MALKGTDVVKKLPDGGKKNCRECGFPTCFAFAMKLASGGVSLDKCPYLAVEVKVLECPLPGFQLQALALTRIQVALLRVRTFVQAPPRPHGEGLARRDAQHADACCFTLSPQLQLPAFQIPKLQASGSVRRVTD